jgi:hypothetical protein
LSAGAGGGLVADGQGANGFEDGAMEIFRSD